MTTQNTTLDLKPLLLSHAPQGFPIAWGWWALLATIIAILLIIYICIRCNKKRNLAKKTALHLLMHPVVPHNPSSAMEILRQAALSYFPREHIAVLHGQAWYEFLDGYTTEHRFIDKQQQWQAALYQSQAPSEEQPLIDDCIFWTTNALPPKKADLKKLTLNNTTAKVTGRE